MKKVLSFFPSKYCTEMTRDMQSTYIVSAVVFQQNLDEIRYGKHSYKEDKRQVPWRIHWIN